ncbi:hypothetical protein RJI07_04690 [Mycoplasmatota bacterium WC30]
MYKRIIVSIWTLSILILLAGCNTLDTNTAAITSTLIETTASTTIVDFEVWRNSDEALDFNGDRKIDELDYEIYQLQYSYSYWRDSEEALDLNIDRKIDELDYEIYKLHNIYDYWLNSNVSEDLNEDSVIDEVDHEIYNYYDNWLNSESAEDLNDDNTIDELDYEIYAEFEEFIGDYIISNYTYDGSSYNVIGDGMYLTNLDQYLDQIVISVDNKGDISVFIPDSTVTSLGDLYQNFVEGLNNMSIARISPFIVGIDTFITEDDNTYNFTLYFTETESGFSTSYVIDYFYDDPEITFDLIKVE